MIDKKDVVENFLLFTKLDEEEAIKWSNLIGGCIDYVFAMLKPNCDIEKNKNRISLACGAMAYYRYCLIEYKATESNIRVENVSVSSNGNDVISNAQALKNEFLGLIADLIKVKSPIFNKVKCYV